MSMNISADLLRGMTIGAAVVIGTVVTLVVNTLPIFLPVLANDHGLTDQQIGFAAMAEAGGIALGTIACASAPLLVSRLNWRRTTGLGVLIFVFANALSIIVGGFQAYAVVRMLAGFGSGITLAILCAVLAQRNAARDLAIFVAVQLGTGWLASPFFTPIASAYGLGGLFGCIMIAGLLSLGLVPFLPQSGSVSRAAQSLPRERITPQGWIAISAAFLYFCGMGAVLTYLAFMGVAWGGSRAVVENDLFYELLASMIGAAAAAVIGSRISFRLPLTIAYAVFMATIVSLIIQKPVAGFIYVVAIFGFVANFLIPFLFAAATEIDSADKTAMLFNAATLGGMAVGPAIAGLLVSSDYRTVNISILLASSLSALLIFIAARLWRGQQGDVLVDA